MSALLAATRPTRRDMLRHPWRLLAAVLLIAVPVIALTAMTSWQTSTDSALRWSDPTTTATYGGTSCIQSISGLSYECEGDALQAPAPQRELLDAALPHGFHAELRPTFYRPVTAADGRQADAQILQLPVSAVPPSLDPGTGSLPTVGEIMLTHQVADQPRVGEGDTVTVDSADLRVSGVLPGYQSLVIEPTFTVDDATMPTFTILGDEPFTWDDVTQLNKAGFVVVSSDVQDTPPPAEEAYPEMADPDQEYLGADWGGWLFFLVSASYLLVLGVLLLLLISPVFTIATSRQSRIFALMSSQGASPAHIRLGVLAYGLGAGLVGATLGLVPGGGGATAWWAVTNPGWPVAVPWGWAGLTWLCAVVGSVAASFLPAWVASRASISTGVQGATPDRMMRWRPWMAVGPVALALTLAVVSLLRLDVLAAPVALVMVLTLTASTPALIIGLARLGRSAPLPFRLATRDAARQSMRSAPALAAIIGVLSVAVSVLAADDADRDRQDHLTATVYAHDVVTVGPSASAGDPVRKEDLAPSIAGVRAMIGPTTEIDLFGIAQPQDTTAWRSVTVGPGWQCPASDEVDLDNPTVAAECLSSQRHDWVSAPSPAALSGVIIAGPEILELFDLGEATRAAAADALAGEAVLSSSAAPPSITAGGEAEVWISDGELEGRPVTMRVHPILPELFPLHVLSRPAAARLGIEPDYLGTALLPDEPVSPATRHTVTEMVTDASLGLHVGFSRQAPASPRWVPGILALGVIVVVTLILALSTQTTRRYFALIDAVGSSPSLPSRTTAMFAGLLAFVGAGVGTLTAYLFTWATASRTTTDVNGRVLETGAVGFLHVDWWLVLLLLVGTPVLAAKVGSLFHRRHREVEYRET